MAAVEKLTPHCTLTTWPNAGPPDEDAMQRHFCEADAILVKTGHKVTAAMFAQTLCPPKIIANIGVGYDNIDVSACRDRAVLVTNTPNVLDETVADLVLALLLSATRRITELDRWIRAGHWAGSVAPEVFGMDLSGTTLGIIGMGRIGQAVARRATRGFSMDVLYHNRGPNLGVEQDVGARYATLPDLLQASDHVVLLAPYAPNSPRLLGAAEFSIMKPTATFVNAARGQLIDEVALVAALKSRTIRAAALDVFEREPVSLNHELLQMANVTLTPHIGSATVATRTNMALRAVENVIAALSGRTPPDLVAELRGAQ